MTNIPDRVFGIVEEQGEDVIYKRITGVTRNTATGARANTSAKNSTIRAAVRNYESTELSGLVQHGDREVRIAAKTITFTPKAQDKISINDEDFNVVDVDILKNRNTIALFILQVRGSNPIPLT